MKKLSLLFFMTISCLLGAAQGVEYGLVGGENFSWMKTKETNPDNTVTSAPRFDGILGCFFRFHFLKKWSLQPELAFSTYGGRQTNTEIELRSVALTALGRVNITPSVFALSGPQAGVLFGAKKNKNKAYEGMHSAWVLGAGYSFREVGSDVGVRYIFGLSDIHAAENVETQLNAFQLVFTARFGSMGRKLKKSNK